MCAPHIFALPISACVRVTYQFMCDNHVREGHLSHLPQKNAHVTFDTTKKNSHVTFDTNKEIFLCQMWHVNFFFVSNVTCAFFFGVKCDMCIFFGVKCDKCIAYQCMCEHYLSVHV